MAGQLRGMRGCTNCGGSGDRQCVVVCGGTADDGVRGKNEPGLGQEGLQGHAGSLHADGWMWLRIRCTDAAKVMVRNQTCNPHLVEVHDALQPFLINICLLDHHACLQQCLCAPHNPQNVPPSLGLGCANVCMCVCVRARALSCHCKCLGHHHMDLN